MPAFKSVLLSVIATLSFGLAQSEAASPPAATAASDSPAVDVAIAPEKLQLAQARLARMQQIADRFSGEAVALGLTDNAWRFELVNHLMSADQATIGRVEGAPDLRSALLTAAAPAAAGAQTKALGEASNDLIYVPIAPCRIVDTRNSGAGGNFGASESRTYGYTGGAAQGGATCTFTAGATPAALAVNVTVVSVGLGNNAAAFGFLSLYPEGGSPTSSWMNYLGSDIKANAGVAAIKQASGKFSVFAQNPTHVVVDLFGVFRAATDGTPNFIAKWDSAGTLGTSSIYDDGTRVHIGPGTVRNNQVEIGGVASNYSGNALVMGNGTQGMSFAQTAVSQWLTDTDFSLMPAFGGAGRLGIGTTSPTHILDIVGVDPQIQLKASQNGSSATLSRYTNRLEISPSDAFQVSVGAVASPDLYVATNHDVGIGTGAPVSRLQIGSVGSSGYGGDDIAFGNGTQASGIAQLSNLVQWYSTTNMALMPAGGSGRVGINTTTPGYPLEVSGFVTRDARDTIYFNAFSASFKHAVISPNISIYASDNIDALEFDASSDARIKNIRGVSESPRDLDTLMRIEVTDYTLKDRIREGDRPFKKVVAQQVESVYPQIVARHVDFIPNIYRTADSVTSNSAGITTLHFAEAHGMDADAKRLKLLVEGESAMRKIAVLGVPSAQDVVIDAADLEGKRVFVYGEEVDDFRTVDYEGLTTLNISATQELVRRMQHQQADAEVAARAKDAQIAALRAELAAQSARIDALQKLAADVSVLQGKAAVASQRIARGMPDGR